jgi:hypothetical protein
MRAKKRAAPAAADELTTSFDFLIRDTRLRLYKYIERRIARQGIPLRVWFPLRVLYRNEGITKLYLTAEGRKKTQQTLREMRRINARITAGFSNAERQSLHALLTRAHENLGEP